MPVSALLLCLAGMAAAGLIATSAVAIAGSGATPTADNPQWASALSADGAPITVYRAKKIYTMDPGRPEANAIAVLDGKVLSTGTMESMQPWLSRYQYTVDDRLRDKVIMPGFVEPHSHFWISAGFLGLAYLGPIEAPNPSGGTYAPVATFVDVLDRLRDFDRSEADPSVPLIAYGVDPAQQGVRSRARFLTILVLPGLSG